MYVVFFLKKKNVYSCVWSFHLMCLGKKNMNIVMRNIYVSFHICIFVPFFFPKKNSSLDHKISKERTILSRMKWWSDLKRLLWKLYCTCNALAGLTLSFDWVEHSPKRKHFKNHFYFSILSLNTITLLKTLINFLFPMTDFERVVIKSVILKWNNDLK